MKKRIRKIVIVGGGTAGWMTAAALARYLYTDDYQIQLVESDQIGTVGVGEATIPGIRDFNNKLGIDENEFMRFTQATYKLGIQFEGWTQKNDKYLHPFGYFGHPLNGVPFHHYWVKAYQQGDTENISDFSLAYNMALKEKFVHPNNDPKSIFSTYFYAFHLNATLYAQFLRNFATEKGVLRTEGKVQQIHQNSENGHITSIELETGSQIEGDLFIDCTGFRGLLIEQTLKTGYQDWSHWLPCDRAVAIQSESISQPLPYTRAIAQKAGWQWRIPLQSRMGNGYVYCSDHISDEAAHQCLLDNIPGKTLTQPNFLKFKTGRRNQLWNKNCVAVGLSSGFLEPLESTSIHLIQTAIMKLITHFPDQKFSQVDIDDYNLQMTEQFEQVKDFLILHYHMNQRQGEKFWDYCRSMSIPDSLKERLELFQTSGHIQSCKNEIFVDDNWLAVYIGQKVIPHQYHPRVDCIPDNQLNQLMTQMKVMVSQASDQSRFHYETIQQFCRADITGRAS